MENRVEGLLAASASSVNYLEYIKCDTTQNTVPFKCAVSTCNNKFTSFEEHCSNPFKFHNFPKDTILSQKWKAYCRIPLETNTENLKVCSDHFTLDDYDRNLKKELLCENYKRSLKDTAIPLVKIGPIVSDDTLNEYVKHNDVNIAQIAEPKIKESTELLQEVRSLETSIRCLMKGVAYRKSSVAKKTVYLAKLKKSLKKVVQPPEKQTENFLRTFLSQTQIELLKGKKKVFWTDDDLARAFTLRHMGGKEFYLYMKNTLNYPLPSLSCVQAWAGALNMAPTLCSIMGCSNSIKDTVKSTIFYSSPKDTYRSTKWADILKDRIGYIPLSKALICCEHFEENAFHANSFKLKDTALPSIFPSASKMEEPAKKKLKDSCVPTSSKKILQSIASNDISIPSIFPCTTKIGEPAKKKLKDYCVPTSSKKILRPIASSDTAVPSIFPCTSKMEEPAKKKLKDSCVPTSSEKNLQPMASNDRIFILEANSFNIKDITMEKSKFSEQSTQSMFENLNIERMGEVGRPDILKGKIAKLKVLEQNLIAKYKKLEMQDSTLQKTILLTKRDLRRKQNYQYSLSQVDMKLLKKCLSPAQIHHLIGKSNTKWSLDDLAMAYVISNLTSHDFYLYLRKELNYPLPAASNMTRCFKNLDFNWKRKRNDESDFVNDE